jgi:hypothetical protein
MTLLTGRETAAARRLQPLGACSSGALACALTTPASGRCSPEGSLSARRSDHKFLLSKQALEIAKRNCAGRKADEPLFPILDARQTLSWINEEAGTKVQGHGLRATFASIAEELVSSALLKRMLNHAAAGDVTLGHYVAKSEAQLRAGWQAVADFVEGAARRADTDVRSPTAKRSRFRSDLEPAVRVDSPNG